MPIILCSIQDCNKSVKARSLCSGHYARLLIKGNPEAPTRKYQTQVPKYSYLSFTYEYGIWSGMQRRIIDQNKPSYKGIKVCERWTGDYGFQNFILDMDWRPSKEYSIDRINTAGDYEPSNCRWALKWQQSSNRLKAARNKSGYIGVLPYKGKWRTYTTHQRKQYFIGIYNDPEQAAIEYDKMVVFLKGKYAVTNIL